jgi:predicted AlkP superfamily pyrophosphatase or phosphodiesterase
VFSAAFFLLTALISTNSQAASTAELKRPLVIVISVDGMGARLLSSLPPSEVPTITKMALGGDQAIRAETVLKAQTVPGHASMLAGVDTPKHRQTENEKTEALKKVEVKTIFDLVKLNGLQSAAFFGKEKLRYVFDTGAIDASLTPRLWPFGDLWARLPSVVTSSVVDLLSEKNPNFLFVHYGLTDTVGHIFKWESAAQREAVRRVDVSIGKIVEFLEAWTSPLSKLRDGKPAPFDDYIVILTADHGGHDGSHGQTTPTGQLEDVESDLVVPWIVYRSSRAVEADGRRPRLKNPKDTVKIYDTAATAAALLQLEVPKQWNWDGVNRVKLEK